MTRSVASRLKAAWWVLWISAVAQWRTMTALISVVTSIVLPAAFLIATSRVAGHGGPDSSTRIVVAVALMSLWTSTVWGAGGVLRRELRDGTFGATVTGLHPPYLVLLGKSLGGTLHALSLIVPTTIVAVLLLRLPVRAADPAWLAVGGLLVVACGTTLGMMLACAFLLTRYGLQLSSALMYPVYLLGGLLVPVSVLPSPLRLVSAAISLRWATQFLVSAAAGRASLVPLGAAAGLTVAYFVVACLAFARIVHLARADGRFEL